MRGTGRGAGEAGGVGAVAAVGGGADGAAGQVAGELHGLPLDRMAEGVLQGQLEGRGCGAVDRNGGRVAIQGGLVRARRCACQGDAGF